MATARVPRMIGAFQGAMPTTTPQAWRRPIASEPGTSDGMTSPAIWVVMAAASRSMFDRQRHVELVPHRRAAGFGDGGFDELAAQRFHLVGRL